MYSTCIHFSMKGDGATKTAVGCIYNFIHHLLYYINFAQRQDLINVAHNWKVCKLIEVCYEPQQSTEGNANYIYIVIEY